MINLAGRDIEFVEWNANSLYAVVITTFNKIIGEFLTNKCKSTPYYLTCVLNPDNLILVLLLLK